LAVPVLAPKRVLFALPGLYLVIAVAVHKLPKQYLIISLLVLTNTISVMAYYLLPRNQREPWRSAIGQIEAVATPGTAVVFAFSDVIAPWKWYADPAIATVTPGVLSVDQTTDLATPLKPLLLKNQIFVFDYLSDLTDPQHRIPAWLNDQKFNQVGFYQYPQIGKVDIYVRQKLYAQSQLNQNHK
jgi:hypothetical protein